MRKRTPLTAIAAVLVAATALTGCSAADQSRRTDASDRDKPSSSAAPGSGSTAPSSPSSKPEPDAPKAVDASALTDELLGHRVKPTVIVRNFPLDPDKQDGFLRRDGIEQVLVKVDVSAGTKYYSQVSCNDLRVTPHGAADTGHSTASDLVIGAAMSKDGFPPLQPVKTGESGSGWCAFVVRDGADKPLDLQYVRIPTTTSDGTTHPQKIFTASLPS